MKRSKRIYVLLGVLVAVCAVTFAVTRYEERQEQIRNSGETILEISSDSVQSLAWEYDGASFAFHKEETWLYDEDAAFSVDEAKIEALLAQFEQFSASFIIEDVEDYSQYGLTSPTCTITLSAGEQTYEIQLGGYSTMDAQRYVSIGDGNVYLVTNDPLDSFDLELSDMIKHDSVPSFDQVTDIQFSGAETYTIVYEEDSSSTYCAEDVYFTQKDNQTAPLDTSHVNSYLSGISSLSLTDYASYNVTDEELRAYGLDTPELTVTVHYTAAEDDGEPDETFTLHIGRNQEELKAAEEAGEDSDVAVTAYVRVGESQIVYQISETKYDALMAVSYDDLRHKEVLTADFADITQIDISLEDTNYTILAELPEDAEDGERVYSYQGEEIEADNLRSAVEALQADSFTSEQPTQKEEIRLVFHLDNETYPQVEVTLYRYDGTNCLAVVDGVPVCFVARSSVVDLIEAVNAVVLG